MDLGNWGSSLKGSNRQWVRTYASGIGVRAKHRRSGDPGLWVRNKERWADRRVMTANNRVRGPRRVSRSSSSKESRNNPGLWVRNKEQWADRRAMTADTRVRGPRRVSRSE